MTMGVALSSRRQSSTNEWKDNSKIDRNNIIHSRRRRTKTARYFSNDHINELTWRRRRGNGNGGSIGRNGDGLLGKRKELPMTNIDTSMQQQSNTNQEMDVNGNHNEKHHNNFLGKQKGVLIHKSNDSKDSHDTSSLLDEELPISNEERSNTNQTMDMNSNHNEKQDDVCSSKQKGSSILNNSDNNDSNDSDLLYQRKELSTTNTDTSSQLRSNTNKVPELDGSLDEHGRAEKSKSKSKSKKQSLNRVKSSRSNLGDNVSETTKHTRTKATTSARFVARFETTKAVQFETKKPKDVATTVPTSNIARISMSNHDNSCPSNRKGNSIKRNSDNDDGNDSCPLDKGKELLMSNIDISNHEQSNINPKMNNNYKNKHDSRCSSTLKGLFANTNSDKDEKNKDGCLLDRRKELLMKKIDPSSQQYDSVDPNTNCDHSNKHDSGRLSKRNRLSMIDLDVAKGIVHHACVAALLGSPDSNHNSTGTPDLNSGDDSIECETEFEDFVKSTISRVIRSIAAANANAEIPHLVSTPKQTRERPTKKRRIAGPRHRHQSQQQHGSKVEGLEHAESLHTMCSLFPLVLGSTEEEEEKEENESQESELETEDRHYAPESESEVESEHSSSDHDSLLPPVGTGSVPTTPWNEPMDPIADDKNAIICCGKTLATMMPEISPVTKTSPRRLRSATRRLRSTFASPLIPVTSDTDTDTTETTLTELPPKHKNFLSHAHGMLPYSSDTDDEDCDYEHPLIGVVEDEGSGIISSQLRMNQYDDSDCIIRFTKVD